MAFDVRVQKVFKKKTDRTDRGVATGVTKFRMASGGLIVTLYMLDGYTHIFPIESDFEIRFPYERIPVL